MSEGEQATIAALRGMLEALEYSPSLRQDGDRYRIQADKLYSCIAPNFVLHGDGTSLFFYVHVRIRDWHIPADKTDAAIMVGTLLGAFLRIAAGVNATVIPEPHVVVDGELSGVFLRFDQPCASWYGTDKASLNDLSKVLDAISCFEMLISQLFDWDLSKRSADDDVECRCGLLHSVECNESWRTHLATHLPRLRESDLDSQYRINPTWHYAHAPRFYLFESPGLAMRFPNLIFKFNVFSDEARDRSITIPNSRGYFVHRGSLRTFLSKRDLRYAHSVLAAVDSEREIKPFCTLENVTLFFSEKHLLFLDTRSGLERYREERVRVQNEWTTLSRVLTPLAKFHWKTIDGDSFESLIFELLQAEPYVTWIKQAGSTRDRNSGKDFIAEMQLPKPDSKEVTTEEVPLRTRLVIVQCKSSIAPVGKSKVRDIRDTIEHHHGAGYLLIVSSTITSSLVDHLLELRSRTSLYVDWWTRSDVEERLIRRPDIIARHRNIVEMSMCSSEEP